MIISSSFITQKSLLRCLLKLFNIPYHLAKRATHSIFAKEMKGESFGPLRAQQKHGREVNGVRKC